MLSSWPARSSERPALGKPVVRSSLGLTQARRRLAMRGVRHYVLPEGSSAGIVSLQFQQHLFPFGIFVV